MHTWLYISSLQGISKLPCIDYKQSGESLLSSFVMVELQLIVRSKLY